MKSRFLLFLIIGTFNSIVSAQTLNWGVYLNTQNVLSASDVAVDNLGNTYTIGFYVNNNDFNPGSGVFTLAELNNDVGNVFCVKLNPNGNFVWAIPVGGRNNFDALLFAGGQPKIAIDNNNGAIYISCAYDAPVDFDPSPATFLLPTDSGNTDVFVAKYTTAGAFVWAKNLGVVTYEEIDVDSSGNVYLAGNFPYTTDIDPGPNVFNLTTNPGGDDFYILKLNPNGEFVWAKQFGDPTRYDFLTDIVIDDADNIVITGLFSGLVDFDPNAGVTNLQSNNNSNDAFVAKYTSNGELIWAKSFGGTSSGIERGSAVTVDNQNNVYATGYFSSVTDFDPSANTFNLSTVGTRSLYILKLTSNGEFDFVKTVGSPFTEFSTDIAVDNVGSLYLTGYYLTSMDCNPDAGVFTITANGGNNEIFLISLSASNGQFGWAKSIGETANDEGKRIAIHEPTNRLTLVGHFQGGSSVDFDAPNGFYLPNAPNSGSGTYIINYSYNSLSNIDFINEDKIIIYPNPANDEITIQSNQDIENYQLIDLTGKVILSQSNSNSINVSSINPGMYLLKILSNNSITTKKVIIK